jgi:hypothetical protein
VDDCAQKVLYRFYRAIVDGRLDASHPKGIGGWLKKTTRSVARDLLALTHNQHEIPTTTGDLDLMAGAYNPEDRMAEDIGVHEVIDRILDKLPPEERAVFVLRRLKAARKAFAQEWNAMKTSGAVVASLAWLTVHELIAAEHTIADVPQGVVDELLRRLGEELGQDFLTGPTSGAVAAGIGAKLGAAAGAAKATGVTLATWQIGLGVLLVGIAGAGLTAALRPAGAAPVPPVTITAHALRPVTPAPPTTIDSAHVPPGGGRADVKPSAPAPSEIQTRLLINARALINGHQPAKALALLSRVTAPDLAEERDGLRELALAQLPDAGKP